MDKIARIERWSGVEGKYMVECFECDATQKHLIKPYLPAGADVDDYEIVIEFESSGYDDPGKFEGAWEDCYPPESEDNRKVTSVELIKIGDKKNSIGIPRGDNHKFEYEFQSEIDEVEIDHRYGSAKVAFRSDGPIKDLPMGTAALIMHATAQEEILAKAIKQFMSTLRDTAKFYREFVSKTGLNKVGTLDDINSLWDFMEGRTGLLQRLRLNPDDVQDAYATAILEKSLAVASKGNKGISKRRVQVPFNTGTRHHKSPLDYDRDEGKKIEREHENKDPEFDYDEDDWATASCVDKCSAIKVRASRIAFETAFADNDLLTPDDVSVFCASCAETMKEKGYKGIRASVLKKKLFKADETNEAPTVMISESTPEFVHWLTGVQKTITDYYTKEFSTLPIPKLEVQMGRKFIRIVKKDSGGGGSAFAFIDRTNGDILKPASWSAPAKHARGNLFDQDHGTKQVGPYGPAYLR